MGEANRMEFERQVALLCAAYNLPVGDRVNAYWVAFGKLGVVEFARLVEAAIGPDGPERLPPVAQLWKLRRALRAGPAAQQPLGARAALVEYVMRTYRPSPAQLVLQWSWIWSDRSQECLGVILPQDPSAPDRHPARRVLFAEVDWQQYLEDGGGRPASAQQRQQLRHTAQELTAPQ